ncbi:MAG: hypothetical protein HY738_07955 [Bacteroidia bacterium]|nr:hypothetical protein [Bacteroidia bacterium]
MKKIITLLTMAFFTYQFAFGQAAGNWNYNQSKVSRSISYSTGNQNIADFEQAYPYQQATVPRYYYGTSADTVITVQVSVLMNVRPDSYQAIFGVQQVCDSIEKGHQLINKRIDRYINNIIKLGIKKEDIYIDFISQVPIFEYEVEKKLFSKSYNEIPKGFELKKNIHINYSDPGLSDKLLIEAAKNEIYDIIKVEHLNKNCEIIYKTLRDTTIRLLNGKVDDFKKAGVKFIPLYHTISESIYTYFPIERYESYGTFNYASLSAVDKSDKLYAGTNEATSLYYNKLPYKMYDLIINPVVVGPVVQYTYTLSMKYVLKKQP